jgi:hypothetical protein
LIQKKKELIELGININQVEDYKQSDEYQNGLKVSDVVIQVDQEKNMNKYCQICEEQKVDDLKVHEFTCDYKQTFWCKKDSF